MVNIIKSSDIKPLSFSEISSATKSLNNYKQARFSTDGGSTWFGFEQFDVVDGKTRHTPTSLQEVVSAFESNRLNWHNSLYNIGSNVNDLTDILIDPYFLTDTYISDSIVPDGESAQNYALGLKRLLDVKPSNDTNFTENNYIYACVFGKWNFYNKKDIGYYDNGTFKTLENLTKAQVEDLANKDLYLSASYNNAPVNDLVDESYSLTQVTQNGEPVMDSVSSTGNQISYNLTPDGTSFEKYQNGNYSYSVSQVTSEFNEQSFVVNNNDAQIKTVVYALSQQGDYLRLNLEAQNQPVAVRVTGENSQIYYMDEYGNHTQQIRLDVENRAQIIQDIIGKKLCVKINDGVDEKWVKTQAITAQQARISYDSQKFMQATKNYDNYLQDDAYLRLSNGQYVKENEFVRPIAYNFVLKENEEFDAYLCYVTNAEGKTETIIAPKDFKGGRLGGYNVSLSNMVRIKKTVNALKDSDVIQTSNEWGAKYNNCVTLKQRVEGAITNEAKENKNEILQNAINQFRENYKVGKYIIDGKVVVAETKEDGSVVNVERDVECNEHGDPLRFIYSDQIYTDDTTHSNSKYKYLLNHHAVVDEASGKIKYGPKFNSRAAIKDFYKKFGKFGMYAGAAFFAGGGLFAVLGAPILLAASAAAYVATGVLAPFYYLAKGFFIKRKKFPDKVEANRNNVKNNLDLQLSKLYSYTREHSKDIEIRKSDIKRKLSNINLDLQRGDYNDLDGIKEIEKNIETLRAKLSKNAYGGEQWAVLEEDYEDYLEKQNYINDNILNKIIFIDGKKVSSKNNLSQEDLANLAEGLNLSIEDLQNNYLTSKGKLKTKEVFKLIQNAKKSTFNKNDEEILKQIYEQKANRTHIITDHLNTQLAQVNQDMSNLRQHFENVVNGDIMAGVHSLSETRYLSLFEIKDGKADITESNAALYSKFKSDIKSVAKKLAKVKNQLQKNPEDENLSQRQNQLQAELYSLINSPKAGDVYDELQDRKIYEDKIAALKTYVGVKYFGGTTTNAEIDAEIVSDYLLNSSMSNQSAKSTKNKKQNASQEQLFNEKLSKFNGEVYFSEQTVDVDGKSVKCVEMDGKLYAKNLDGELRQVKKDKDGNYSLNDIEGEKPNLNSQKMFGASEISVINTSGNYEKPVDETIETTPPTEKTGVEETKSNKKDTTPNWENDEQKQNLYKVIVYAGEIANAGINAPKSVNDFKEKLKHINKYYKLVNSAAATPPEKGPLKVVVDGKEQIIEIGWLATTSNNITQIKNIVAQINSAKTK